MNKSPFSKLNLILLILSFILINIVIDSCRKVDINRDKKVSFDQTSRFFTIPFTTDPRVRAIAQKIKRQNDQYNFVNDLVKRVGLPVWDKSLIGAPFTSKSTARGNDEDSSMEYVYIPFADTMVNAFLIVGLTETDTAFRLLNAFEYKNFSFDTIPSNNEWTARNMFHMFTYFENEIFDHNTFYIDDKRLFPLADTTKHAIVKTRSAPSSNRSSFYSVVELCWTVDVCFEPPGGNYQALCGGECDENCQYYDHSYDDCVSFWAESGGSWAGNQPPFIPQNYTGGPGNNGQGTGTWWPDICNGNTYCSSPGWHTVMESLDHPFNPEVSDTISISPYLRDHFPCTFTMLNTTLPNLNYIAQMTGKNVFNDSAYMHITYDTMHGSHPGFYGWTDSGRIKVDGDGYLHYSTTIHLDTAFLKHATEEAIATVILHETMHAILTMRLHQYEQWKNTHTGQIDSTFMKTRYPISWEAYGGQIPTGEESHHEMIGRDYTNYFISLCQQLYNPLAPIAVRDSTLKALAYGGLNNTTVWQQLPDSIRCKYARIGYAAAESYTGPYTISGCNSNYVDVNSFNLTPNCNH